MTKKFCNVTGGGQQQDFDLMSESENVSSKSKMMSGAAGKGVPGGGLSGGK